MADEILETQNGRFYFANADDYIARMMRRDGHWEVHICEALMAIMPEKAIIRGLDVGANIGAFSIQLASIAKRKGAQLQIQAFEVQPLVFSNLIKNIELNCLGDSIQAHQLAIGAESGEIEFDVLDNTRARNAGAFSLSDEITKNFDVGLPVCGRSKCRSISLDTLDLASIDFIKIDVEGMELEILRSIEPWLMQNATTLLLEIWSAEKAPWYQERASELLSMLRAIYQSEVKMAENYLFFGKRTEPQLETLADELRRSGSFSRAAGLYLQLLKKDPMRWNYMLGICLRSAGDNELALHYLRRHEMIAGPSRFSRRHIAYALQSKQDYPGAKSTLFDALALFPGEPELVSDIFKLLQLSLSDAEITRLFEYCADNDQCLNIIRAQNLEALRQGADDKICADKVAANFAKSPAEGRQVLLSKYYKSGSLTCLSDYASNGQDNGKTIPMFAFWDKTPPPDEIAGNFRTWRDRSSLEQPLFDVDSARSFIHVHFDAEVVTAFDRAHHPAMKADIFRLAKIFQEGGMYLDADERAIAPFGILWSALSDANIDRLFVLDIAPHLIYVHNYLLVAHRNDAIIGAALDIAVQNTLAGNTVGRIWSATGPGALTQAVCVGLSDKDVVLRTGFISSIAFRKLFQSDGMDYKKKPEQNWRNH